MRINIQKLREAGYEVHIDNDQIDIVPSGRHDDSGVIWKEIHETASRVLEEPQLTMVTEETVMNIQKHHIISLFDM